MNIKRTLACASILAASVALAIPQGEVRTHYVIADRDHKPLFYATTIHNPSPEQSRETYLITDPAGRRIRVDVNRDMKAHTHVADYSINGKPVGRVKADLPFKSTTREAAIDEIHKHPEEKAQDVPVTIEAHGQSLATSEHAWKDLVRGPNEHAHAKALIGSDAETSLGQLQSVFAFPPLGGACTTLPFVTDGRGCAASTGLFIAMVPPDCDYDGSFGTPCSAAQHQKAKAKKYQASSY